MEAIPIYQGESYKLQQALRLARQDRLTEPELAEVIEGGAACARQGVKMAASHRQGADAARTLTALTLTGRNLLNRAWEGIKTGPAPELPADRRRELAARIAHWQTQVNLLDHWVEPMTRGMSIQA